MDNEQEIRRVLAEFCGWTWLEGTDGWVGHHEQGKGIILTMESKVPDYLHDLNAMHEVALELAKQGQGYEYYVALHDIALDGRPEVPLRRFVGRHLLLLTEATAAQRAQAAYQVISQQIQQQKEG